jgi:mRNA deadenylase 3'-5' endonuclease subunit Ccr4
VLTHGTRAAYEPGQTSGRCRSWRLDHILYSARTLRPAVVWETLEADPRSSAEGLPNRRCPSDHLASAHHRRIAVFVVCQANAHATHTPCSGT